VSAPHVGIVGGGVLGLTLALGLRKRGHRVTVLEGAAAPGGLAAPAEIGGFTWDRFYHVIAPGDEQLLGLLDELDLTDAVRWGTTRTGFFTDDRFHSMSSSWEFLRFPPLSLVDKARLGLTILHASRITDGRSLEDVPAVDWLRRWSGRNTLERIWLPLLKAKLGENYRQASAAFIWAIVARMYAARRSGLKREQFGYVDGGYDRVLRRLRERLEESGVELGCGAPVTGVQSEGAGPRVTLAGGAERSFDQVILTIPATKIPTLCPDLTPAERSRLERVVYQGIVCASLLLKRPLSGFYVTNITEAWVPFTAVIETTALVDRDRFGGHTLVYLPRYLTQDDAFWRRSDDEVRTEFVAALRRMYPDLRSDDIVAFRTSRVREVLALATRGYTREALPPTRTSLPGVWIVNSAQIANGTLNLNETVGLARRKLDELGPVFDATRPAREPAAR
jgi:protoporphyrinogen oxidase